MLNLFDRMRSYVVGQQRGPSNIDTNPGLSHEEGKFEVSQSNMFRARLLQAKLLWCSFLQLTCDVRPGSCQSRKHEKRRAPTSWQAQMCGQRSLKTWSACTSMSGFYPVSDVIFYQLAFLVRGYHTVLKHCKSINKRHQKTAV